MADPRAPTMQLTPEPDDEGTGKTHIFPGQPQVQLPPDAVALTEVPGVARYEELNLLGEGGMGEVRLCRDARIGREVARKVMRVDAAAFADGQQRFLREARVQGQLEHPVVVPVYELGEEK